jgi:DNA helicase-2/ATP-dependent DNA helicase PcrA
MSRTSWRSCAGPRTRATALPVSGCCSCSPASVPQPRAILAQLSEEAFAAGALTRVSPPSATAVLWPGLCRVIARLRDTNTAWQAQIGLVRDWYQPLLDRLYDYPAARAGDLDQLEQIAFGYASRERFLTELTLDPPDASGAEAGRPLLDEDFLILSTIHSAKGQEWDTVFILNLVDGCIPSDMATGKPEQIDEERRLLYVAMTRAREHLYLVRPRRFYRTQQHRHGRGHVLAPRSRFLPDEILGLFARVDSSPFSPTVDGHSVSPVPRVDISIRLREMWR